MNNWKMRRENTFFFLNSLLLIALRQQLQQPGERGLWAAVQAPGFQFSRGRALIPSAPKFLPGYGLEEIFSLFLLFALPSPQRLL